MKKVASLTGRNGFTLFEVLLAVTVFALGATVIFPVFLKSTDMISIMKHRSEAGLFLENWIAETQQGLKTGKAAEGGSRGRWQSGGQTYEYNFDVRRVAKGSSLYRLEMIIEWRDFRQNKIEKTFYAIK